MHGSDQYKASVRYFVSFHTDAYPKLHGVTDEFLQFQNFTAGC
jgi:hypothetical protein